MPVMKMFWLKKDDILRQVKSEYNQSRNVVQNKRLLFRDRWKLYNEQTKNNDKVSVNLVYSNIQALMALSYTDDLMVEFIGREYSDVNTADIWTKMAEFDKEEMNMSLINYSVRWNKFFYGVGIRVFDRYDERKNCPIIYSPNIMTWMPDPLWWLSAEYFRWMWFECMMTKDQMKELWFANIESFKKRYQSEFYNWNPYNRLATNNESDTNDDRNAYYVYNHYFIAWGKKYWVSTNFQFTEIGRLREVDAIMKDERFDIGNTMRPVNLTYYRPEEYNPYGTSVTDLSEDKQRTLSKLLNLAVAKAIRSSLWGTRLYNKDKIPNRTDLANLTKDPKLIWVSLNPGESIWDILTEVQMSQVPQDNFNVSDMVNYQNRIATGLDPMTLGVATPGDTSATEAQQIQSNANLILWYGNVIDFLGEKDFWRKYYKCQKQNLKGKKLVRVINGLGIRLLEINRNDLKTKEDPDVMIKSKNEQKAKNKEQAQNLAAISAMLPEWYGKIYLTRKVMKMMGLDEDESRVVLDPTGAEEEAMRQVMLLNKNQDLNPVTDVMEDHGTYISIYRQAIDTPAKKKAIANRIDAKIEKEKKMKEMQQQMEQQQAAWVAPSQPKEAWAGMGWIAQNQLMNSALQKQKQITTAQDIQPVM